MQNAARRAPMKEQGEFRMRNGKTGDSRRDPSTSLGVTASEPAKKIFEWRPGVAQRAMPGQAERKKYFGVAARKGGAI